MEKHFPKLSRLLPWSSHGKMKKKEKKKLRWSMSAMQGRRYYNPAQGNWTPTVGIVDDNPWVSMDESGRLEEKSNLVVIETVLQTSWWRKTVDDHPYDEAGDYKDYDIIDDDKLSNAKSTDYEYAPYFDEDELVRASTRPPPTPPILKDPCKSYKHVSETVTEQALPAKQEFTRHGYESKDNVLKSITDGDVKVVGVQPHIPCTAAKTNKEEPIPNDDLNVALCARDPCKSYKHVSETVTEQALPAKQEFTSYWNESKENVLKSIIDDDVKVVEVQPNIPCIEAKTNKEEPIPNDDLNIALCARDHCKSCKHNPGAVIENVLPEKRICRRHAYEHMVKVLKLSIVENVRVEDVLSFIPCIEDQCKIRAIGKFNPREAVRTLLEDIEQCSDEEKWIQFVTSLKRSGYNRIVQSLKGCFALNNDYNKRLLKDLTPEIRYKIVAKELLEHLHAKDVLSDADVEEIRSENTNKGNLAAVDLMLDRIPRKHEQWYSEFIDALKAVENDDIACFLECKQMVDMCQDTDDLEINDVDTTIDSGGEINEEENAENDVVVSCHDETTYDEDSKVGINGKETEQHMTPEVIYHRKGITNAKENDVVVSCHDEFIDDEAFKVGLKGKEIEQQLTPELNDHRETISNAKDEYSPKPYPKRKRLPYENVVVEINHVPSQLVSINSRRPPIPLPRRSKEVIANEYHSKAYEITKRMSNTDCLISSESNLKNTLESETNVSDKPNQTSEMQDLAATIKALEIRENELQQSTWMMNIVKEKKQAIHQQLQEKRRLQLEITDAENKAMALESAMAGNGENMSADLDLYYRQRYDTYAGPPNKVTIDFRTAQSGVFLPRMTSKDTSLWNYSTASPVKIYTPSMSFKEDIPGSKDTDSAIFSDFTYCDKGSIYRPSMVGLP